MLAMLSSLVSHIRITVYKGKALDSLQILEHLWTLDYIQILKRVQALKYVQALTSLPLLPKKLPALVTLTNFIPPVHVRISKKIFGNVFKEIEEVLEKYTYSHAEYPFKQDTQGSTKTVIGLLND